MISSLELPLHPKAKDVYQFMAKLTHHAHAQQKYGDKPYTYHLYHVENSFYRLLNKVEILQAMELTGWAQEYSYEDIIYFLRAAALGHDLIEDTDITDMFLREKEIPEFVIQIIVSMTKDDGETLEQYLTRLMGNVFAIFIKKADSFSNLQHSLQEGVPRRIRKYTKTLNYLTGVTPIVIK